MTRTMLSVIGTGLLTAVFQLSAQAPEPPKVLLMSREDIKEGKFAAHERSEAKVAQMFAKNKYPAYYLGMTSMTNSSQAWFMEAHDSFVSVAEAQAFIEKIPEFESLDATDSEYRTSTHAWLAVYRPELSYHASQGMESLAKARYFNVTIFRLRLGHEPEFTELVKTGLNAVEKAANDQPVAIYRVVSGMPTGTYMALEPSASLKTMDEAPARGRAMMQAMGESEFVKFLRNVGEVVVNEEPILLSINPKMSYVSKAFAAGDPDFWTPAQPKAVSKVKSPEKTVAAK